MENAHFYSRSYVPVREMRQQSAARSMSLGQFVIGSAIALCSLIEHAKAGEDMELQNKRVHGVIVDGGVVCPLLLADDGTRLALQGVVKNWYPVGTKLLLEGHFVRVSKCMQGTKTLHVEKVLNIEVRPS